MEIDQKFHDKIAELCLKRFKTLPKSGKPKPNEWTVLSCIILELKGDLRVIAVGTGSKCIGSSEMSSNGDILNDSHAEVICRRSFLRYVLDEMKNGSTFLKFNESTKKYIIQNDAKFHFFTTHIPCGDASIFVKKGIEDFGKAIRYTNKELSHEYEVPRKIARVGEGDIFRTGAKCLPIAEKQDAKTTGCEYHVLGVVRTKPGRGDPTLSVSCSDKMSRWCHLGIQGAFLSLLLEKPIYFSTFTIAAKTPFSKDALERALYNRLGKVKLQAPYQQEKIIIAQSTLAFDCAKESTKQPSDCSISWCDVKDKNLEVAVEGRKQGVTKKNFNTPSARLKICKLDLFKSFVDVCELHDIKLGHSCDVNSLSYKEAKMLAVDYNNCWETLRESFKVWTTKDTNLLHFFIK